MIYGYTNGERVTYLNILTGHIFCFNGIREYYPLLVNNGDNKLPKQVGEWEYIGEDTQLDGKTYNFGTFYYQLELTNRLWRINRESRNRTFVYTCRIPDTIWPEVYSRYMLNQLES